jgi:hypothetical protein
MSDNDTTTEQRILRMVKKVLTDVAKDTHTPPGLKHPLSQNTMQGIVECLELITSREAELYGDSTSRPRFIDEPAKDTVVQFDTSKHKNDKD